MMRPITSAGVFAEPIHQDRLVLGAEQLSAYDSIQLGKTQLLFVPLCGPGLHAWHNAGKSDDDEQPNDPWAPKDDKTTGRGPDDDRYPW